MQITQEYHKMLRLFRKKAKMTQEEISEELNIPQSTISKMESGRHIIDIQTFVQWIRVTNSEIHAATTMFSADVLNNALQVLQAIPMFGGLFTLWI